MTHKIPSYGLIDDEIHTPMEVGKVYRKNQPNICILTDADGDNISDLNEFFHEGTGIYWIWKNINDIEYIGIEHYRRRWANISEEDIKAQLSSNDVITMEPFILPNSLYEQYKNCHSLIDIESIKIIIKNYFPSYIKSWEKYIEKDNILYPCNMFIMKKKDFNKMCDFVFFIIWKFMQGMNIGSSEALKNHITCFSQRIGSHNVEWDKYQMGIGGYLFERLTTLYIRHNFNNICHNEVINMEKN